jgi:hypothetical protein
MKYFYANENNQPVGPHTAEHMRQLYQQGALHENSWVIAEGAAEWKSYASLFLSAGDGGRIGGLAKQGASCGAENKRDVAFRAPGGAKPVIPSSTERPGAPSASTGLPQDGSPPPLGHGQPASAEVIKTPAIALMVCGGVGGALSALGGLIALGVIVWAFVELSHPEEVVGQCVGLLFLAGIYLATSVVILLGAMKMRKLQGYNFATTAAILAIIPCCTPLGIISIAFGVLALIALRKAEVRSAFR